MLHRFKFTPLVKQNLFVLLAEMAIFYKSTHTSKVTFSNYYKLITSTSGRNGYVGKIVPGNGMQFDDNRM